METSQWSRQAEAIRHIFMWVDLLWASVGCSNFHYDHYYIVRIIDLPWVQDYCTPKSDWPLKISPSFCILYIYICVRSASCCTVCARFVLDTHAYLKSICTVRYYLPDWPTHQGIKKHDDCGWRVSGAEECEAATASSSSGVFHQRALSISSRALKCVLGFIASDRAKQRETPF